MPRILTSVFNAPVVGDMDAEVAEALLLSASESSAKSIKFPPCSACSNFTFKCSTED